MSNNLKNASIFLFLALVSLAVVLVWVGIHTYSVMEGASKNSKHSQAIRCTIDHIRLFDEMRSNSTLLAVNTGNIQWENRHHEFERKVDSALHVLVTLDTFATQREILVTLDSASAHIKVAEHRILDLVRGGRLQDASAITTGSEYSQLRNIYSQGLLSFIRLNEQEADKQQALLSRAAIRSGWFFGLILLVLVVVCLFIERLFRKSRAQILKQNLELEQQIKVCKESERARLESQLQIEKAQVQLFESNKAYGIGFWEWNLQTNEVYQSPEFKKQIGYSDDEAEGRQEFYISHLHPEDAETVIESLRQLKLGAIDKLDLEYRFCHKDGSFLWMMSRTSLQRDENGQPLLLYGTHIDITERKKSEELIRELNERFNLISQATNDCVYDWDILANKVWWNQALSRLFNYPQEIVTTDYQWWEERIHPDDLDSLMQSAQRVFDEGMESWTGEYRFRRADGSYAFVFDRGVVLYDNDKKPTRWIGSLMDITEQKLVEAEVVKSEAKFKMLFETANDAIFIMDDRSFIDCNVKTEQIFGRSKDEIIGHSPQEFSPEHQPDGRLSADMAKEKISAALNGESQFFEWVHCRKDGLLFDVEVSLNRIALDGKFFLQAIVRDISERKKAEEKINMLAHAVENSADCIAMADKDFNFIFVNNSFQKVYGYKKEEVVGRPVAILISENNPPELDNDLFTAIERKETWSGEVFNKRRDGIDFPVHLSLSPLLNSKGELIATVGTLRDITERKRAEMELRKSEERLREISKTDFVWEVDENGVYTYTSQTGIDFFGSSWDDIVGKTPFDFMIPDDRERMVSIFSEIVANKAPIKNLENWNVKKDGELCCLLTNGLPILDDKGNLKGYRGVDRDITERKHAEAEIHKSEQRYRNLFENAGIAIWEEDLSEVKAYIQELRERGVSDFRLYFDEHIDEVIKCTSLVKLLDVNKEVLNVVKAKSKEEVTNNLSSYFIEESLSAAKEELIGLSEGRLRVEGEIPLRILTGEIRQILFQLTIVSGYEDTWEKALFSFVDITERKRIEESLRFFRMMIDKSQDAIEVIDVETAQFVDVNEKACTDLGYSRDELLSMKVYDIDPNQNAHDFQQMMQTIRESKSMTVESLHLRKDGSSFPVEINIAVVKLEKAYTIAIVRDITEKKLIENKLRRSEEQLKEAQFVGLIGSWELDVVNNTGTMSDEMYEIFDLNSHPIDVTLETFLTTPIPEDREMVRELVMKSLEARKGIDFDFRTNTSSGEVRWIHERSTVEVDGKGDPKRVFGTCQDITERKLAELKLKESEENFRSMFKNGSAAMAIIEPDTAISMVNDEFCKLVGYSMQEVIGKSWLDRIPPEDMERLNEYNRRRLMNANDVPDKYEFTFYKKSGEIRHALMSITMLRNKKRIASFVDITERIQAEEEIQFKNEQLLKLNAEKDKFFSIIAHDLKSPFSSIMGFSEILIKQVMEKNYQSVERYSSIIHQSSQRAMDLLTNLMEWSRSQTGRMEFNPEYFEMVKLINEVTLLFADAASQKSITITEVLPPNAPVFADKYMMSTVLRNLISNAIKFTYKGGEIVVSIEKKQGESIVSVRDNGVGIPKNRIEKLFRIDENISTLGTEKEKGTGLGVVLCKEFVEKHGGQIWVESEEGKGSVFYFTIPSQG